MAELIINGNTYQGIDYIRVKKANGSTATYIDSKTKDNRDYAVGVSVITNRKTVPVIFKPMTFGISVTKGVE